jgi:hypothetical protein
MHDNNDEGSIGPDDPEKPYEVGYGKPPKATQFKKGNKASNGRPKGAKGFRTLVIAAASEKMSVKRGGKIKKKGMGAVAIDQIFYQGAAGDPRFAPLAAQLQERYLPQDEAPSAVPARDDPDIATLRNYLAWHDQLYGCDDDEASDGEEDSREP